MKKKTNYITPSGYEKLTTEHDELLLKERPEILKVIQWAAGNGDRSENADYLYGKKRLREIDRRMRFLKKQIDNAHIVNPELIESQVVMFGATITIVDEEENERTYCIVGVDEIDTTKNWISLHSPIGKSLMGNEEGDVVTIHTPGGIKEFEIISITYQKIY
jgi:transcription elongation factor GreB